MLYHDMLPSNEKKVYRTLCGKKRSAWGESGARGGEGECSASGKALRIKFVLMTLDFRGCPGPRQGSLW